MRQRLQAASARGLIVPLDATFESAVVIRLAQLATPGAALGALILIGEEALENRARRIAEHFTLPVTELDLQPFAADFLTLISGSIAGVRLAHRSSSPLDNPTADDGLAEIVRR